VLDTGANLSHEDLVNRLWTNPGETPGNSVDDDDNGFVDDVYGWDFDGWSVAGHSGGDNDVNDPSTATHSHGTSTSSIIGAQGNNGLGIAGVAGGNSPTSGIRLMILRVGTDSNITLDAEIGAIDYAIAEGADVISMSFGGFSGGDPEESAINRAWNAGIYLAAAAGNIGQGNENGNGDPLIDLPAGFDNCVCVGATTIFSTQTVNAATEIVAETLAGYSKTGPEMEISAPGTHVMAAANQDDLYTDTTSLQFTGTSAATPVVAGLAALLLSFDPTLTNVQLRDRINTYCTDLGASGRDEMYGYGRIDMLAAITENNVNPSTKPGDTNGDDVVDENDLQPIIANFGKRVGDSGYAAQIDTNSDGVIDELDLFEVGREFGN
jgi:subtilisin family serine protease